jgi:hypothetical protein
MIGEALAHCSILLVPVRQEFHLFICGGSEVGFQRQKISVGAFLQNWN